MMQWGILYRKEMTEMWRNYKWVWVPLVFVMLGIMQPLTFHYLPQIIDSIGNMPEGAVFEMPAMSGGEVLAQTLGQYGTVGTLVIVLAFMAVLSGERAAGVAGIIMVRPVSWVSYVTSKWVAMLTLTTASFALGYMATWYYTNELFGSVSTNQVIGSFLFYWIWLLFILAITLLFSAMLRSSGAVAFVTLASVIALSALASLLPHAFSFSPSHLSTVAAQTALAGIEGTKWVRPVIAAVLGIFLFQAAAIFIAKRQELPG